ncbi:MAG: acyl-CoA thioesterase [Methylobacterium sp.]
MQDDDTQPRGELTVRILAMPADANAAGDIFGGWVMSQMDLAAGIRGAERARGRVATVAVNALAFRRPVHVGDTLCVYTRLERVGRTSITLAIEAWARRYLASTREKVTEGVFVMVALDEAGQPTPVPIDPPAV